MTRSPVSSPCAPAAGGAADDVGSQCFCCTARSKDGDEDTQTTLDKAARSALACKAALEAPGNVNLASKWTLFKQQ